MARPKEFDRDKALQGAIALFSQKGYAGASTAELLDAMGIGRQSMYDTFGDKRALYLAALERYSSENIALFVGEMRQSASPLEGLREALLGFARRSCTGQSGCLGIGAVLEWGRCDADVTALTDQAGAAQTVAVTRQLAQAREAGELGAEVDVDAGVSFVASAVAGIRVMARAGVPAATLEQIVELTIRALKTR